MVLSYVDLDKAVKEEGLEFTPPLTEEQWGPTNVDLRLGYQFTRFTEAGGITVSLAEGVKNLGSASLWSTADLTEPDDFGNPRFLTIDPGEFILARTLERVKIPNHLIGMVEGRSSYARFGLSMHQTAPWIHPGFNGPITLEIRNSGKIRIQLTPKKDRICQLTIFKLETPVPEERAYSGGFQHQRLPLDPKQS